MFIHKILRFQRVFLIVLALFLVGCEKDEGPFVQLEITGNTSRYPVSRVYVRISDMDTISATVNEADIQEFEVAGRDLSGNKEPLNIRLKYGSGYNNQVLFCAIGFDSNGKTVMSAATITGIHFGNDTEIHLAMNKDRVDEDGDCASPIDPGSLADCDDTNPNRNSFLKEEPGDGVDNNCNGQIDEQCKYGEVIYFYDGDSDLVGKGICRNGEKTCYGIYYSTTKNPVYPKEEECNNSLDDDCDGETDEGCVCQDGDIYYCWMGLTDKDQNKLIERAKATYGHFPKIGANNCTATPVKCEGGHLTCSLTAGMNTVTYKNDQYVEDKCDGIDDDCDGLIDEHFDADSDGYNECGSINPNVEGGQLVDQTDWVKYKDCNEYNPNIHPYDGDDECYNGSNCIKDEYVPTIDCGYLHDDKQVCYANVTVKSICGADARWIKDPAQLCTINGIEHSDKTESREPCKRLDEGSCTQNVAPRYTPMADDEYDVLCGSFNCNGLYAGWSDDNLTCRIYKDQDINSLCHNKDDGVGCQTFAEVCQSGADVADFIKCGSSDCRKEDTCRPLAEISGNSEAEYCVVNAQSSNCNGRMTCNNESRCVVKAGASCNGIDETCEEGQHCVNKVCCTSECDQICSRCDDNGECQLDPNDTDCTQNFLSWKDYPESSSRYDSEKSTCKGGVCKCSAQGVCVGKQLGSYCEQDSDCSTGFSCVCGSSDCQTKICVNDAAVNGACNYYGVEDGQAKFLGSVIDYEVNGSNLIGPFAKCEAPATCNGGACLYKKECSTDTDCNGYKCVCGDEQCSSGRCSNQLVTSEQTGETCRYYTETLVSDNVSSTSVSLLTGCNGPCKAGVCVKNNYEICTSDDECYGYCRYKDDNLAEKWCVQNNANTKCNYINSNGEEIVSKKDVEDARCGDNQSCHNGKCAKKNGQDCSENEECISGYCSNVSADGTTHQCTPSVVTQCYYYSFGDKEVKPLSDYVRDGVNRCDNNRSCYQGSCFSGFDNGVGCDVNDDCKSGHCSYLDADAKTKRCTEYAAQQCYYMVNHFSENMQTLNDVKDELNGCNGNSICHDGDCLLENGEVCGDNTDCYSGNCEFADSNAGTKKCHDVDCGDCGYGASPTGTCSNLDAYVKGGCGTFTGSGGDGYTADLQCDGKGVCRIVDQGQCGNGLMDNNCESDEANKGCIAGVYYKQKDFGLTDYICGTKP